MRWLVFTMLAACGRVSFEPIARDGGASDGVPDARSPIVARFAAESGQLTANFHIDNDVTANGGFYVVDGNPEGLGGIGSAAYAFTVAGGTYYLWGRVRATTTAVDSFFLDVDGGTQTYYQSSDCAYLDRWVWVVVTTPRFCGDPFIGQPFPLAAGAHTLTLRPREGGSAVDEFVVVDDPAFVVTD